MISASAIDAHLTTVGAADRYVACSVRWNDGHRGVQNIAGTPTLSCIGNNITDAFIVTEDGKRCPFLSPPNLDETIGVVDADKVLFAEANGTSVSAQEVIESLQSRAEYMGYTEVDCRSHPTEKVVVRFQSAWVPVPPDGSTKIVPEHYSYQTFRREDPRNLIVLGTPQGVFVHSDDRGANKLYAHRVDPATGAVSTHFFEAEANKNCRVGDTAADGPSPTKKARAVEMGIKGMGARTNCFVVLSIPNQQDTVRSAVDQGVVYRSLSADVPRYRGGAYSARVSVSEDVCGTAEQNKIPIRRVATEPIVVTLLTYNTVEVDPDGGCTVDADDVARGVADLDRQYRLVTENGGSVCKLSELPAMLHKLTSADVATVQHKLATDPMVPAKDALAAFA